VLEKFRICICDKASCEFDSAVDTKGKRVVTVEFNSDICITADDVCDIVLLSDELKFVTLEAKRDISDAVVNAVEDTLLTTERNFVKFQYKDFIWSLLDSTSEYISLKDVFKTSTVDDSELTREPSSSVLAETVFTRNSKSPVCDKADLVSAESELTDSFKLSTVDLKLSIRSAILDDKASLATVADSTDVLRLATIDDVCTN